MVSRKLARGDWAGAFGILVELGEQLLEADPDEFAWHAFRGLAGGVRWRHDVMPTES
jgi:hypothetical protein